MIMNDNQSIERGEVVSNGEDQDQDGMNESYIFQTNVLIDCERMTAEAQQTSKSNVSNFFMVDKETHYPNEEAIALLRIPLLVS